MDKKIKNLVFYKYYDKDTESEVKKTQVFYEDGTARNLSLEEGVLEGFKLQEQGKLENIEVSSKVHFLTADELIRNYSNLQNGVNASEVDIEENVVYEGFIQDQETPEAQKVLQKQATPIVSKNGINNEQMKEREVPVVVETPEVEEAFEETPIIEEISEEDTPIVGETTTEQEVPVVVETPDTEETPIIEEISEEDTPIVEETATEQEVPVVVETPEVEEAFEETPIIEEISEEDTPIVGETTTEQEVPVVVETPDTEETPIIEEISEEDTPIVEETIEDSQEAEDTTESDKTDDEDEIVIPVPLEVRISNILGRDPVVNVKQKTTSTAGKANNNTIEDKSNPKTEKTVDNSSTANSIKNKIKGTNDDYDEDDIYSDSVTDDTQDSKKKEKKEKKKKKKKRGFFAKVTAIVVAAALAIGGIGTHIFGKNKKADSKNMKKSQVTVKAKPGQSTTELTEEDIVTMAKGKNFSDLIKLTTNETQKIEMQKMSTFLTFFNGAFANNNTDEDKNIRPALKWNEVNALNLAYNDFTKDEIKAIYNGHELDVNKLDGYFKTANLELMGAFVLETRSNPVNLSNLFKDNKEGLDYYEKMNNLFLKCKETTGQEQIDNVNKFYKQLSKDFPITEKVRTDGIAHSDSRDDIEGYKLSVMPMVAAAEMMFQNLNIDHTMSDKVIDYFNDNGLCNFANSKFERAAELSRIADTDRNNPLYNQFKQAKINELKAAGWYNVKDKQRDLSKLDEFKRQVNRSFEYDKDGNFTGKSGKSTSEYSYTSTESKTTVKTSNERTTEETSSKKEASKKAGKEATNKAKDAVDKETNKRNKKAKQEGEAAAKKNQQAMQKEADKEAESVKQEAENSNKDLNNKIEDANNQIDNNNKDTDTSNDKPVNEKDFGDHNVDFDDNYSDSNGDLDDSVQDNTPDGSGAYEDFPDPNESGSTFSLRSRAISNEELADMIVEDMAANPTTSTVEEVTYQYTR